ncbi:hypothetical protein GCM10023148_58290 [Actinokineospora soli]
MRFHLLGPLEVVDGADAVHVPAGRLRVLLASLAYRSGRPVPVDDLRRHMWGEPDAGSAVTVRSYVRRLRTALGEVGS